MLAEYKNCKRHGNKSVAVYVDADKDALFVKKADEAIRLDDGGYLDSKQIINAAKKSGAQAIHPDMVFYQKMLPLQKSKKRHHFGWSISTCHLSYG